MSKSSKRKITVNTSSVTSKDKSKVGGRPSVFERLGTKAATKDLCHNWVQFGTCPYGKGCKYSSTHTLVSPSKQRQAAKQGNESKKDHSVVRDNSGNKKSAKSQKNSNAISTSPAVPSSATTNTSTINTSATASSAVTATTLTGATKGNSLAENFESSNGKGRTSTENTTGLYPWDPEELEDADADDLEKRRDELQRQLELQMKMDNKARKKKKKRRSSSSESSSSSSSSSSSCGDSTSSTDDTTSTSSSSGTAIRRRKTTQTKSKRRSVSSSTSCARKQKPTKPTKSQSAKERSGDKLDKKMDKIVKPEKRSTQSPSSPNRNSKRSQTPPPPPKAMKDICSRIDSRSKSPPRPTTTRTTDAKEVGDKRRTPSPKHPKEKDKNKEKERKEREKDKERGREREKEREREREKMREREREREREKEREREREKARERDRDKRRDVTASKLKRRDSPESRNSREKKPSPTRSRESGSGSSKKDSRRNSPTDRRPNRSAELFKSDRGKNRKDRQDSRERLLRQRRIEREEREAAREKEREEALARCQERQRERERLKELARKEEERRNRDRTRRDDRGGLDKPPSDRVERLLPLPADRIPPARRDNKESSRDRRDRSNDRSAGRSASRKSADRHDRERDFDRNFVVDRTDSRSFDRERDYKRGCDEKSYDSPYDRRYRPELEDRFNENSRDERLSMEAHDFRERDGWDERELDRGETIEGRRYAREDSRAPPSVKGSNRGGGGGADWDSTDYAGEHEWDRSRRPANWERGNWDDDEWRHYNRSMESWTAEDRRRFASEWRERDKSRPRSNTSHHRDDETSSTSLDGRKKEPSKAENVNQESEYKENGSKRAAEETLEKREPKKTCLKEPPLEDDLSEISDEADDILNREEEALDLEIVDELQDSKSQEAEGADLAAALACHKSCSPIETPKIHKDDSVDDDNIDLDFEEISEDELEEETRVKGLGDALGVDWASLVAEVRPIPKPFSSAKKIWEPYNLLASIGVSVQLAGEELVRDILQQYEAEQEKDQVNHTSESMRLTSPVQLINGNYSEMIHPIAGIQVVTKQRNELYKHMFTSPGLYRRALCAKQDLMLRRHMCRLPLSDEFASPPRQYDPDLFKQACRLFQ